MRPAAITLNDWRCRSRMVRTTMLAVLSLSLVVACASRDQRSTAEPSASPRVAKLQSYSIFGLASNWRDQHGVTQGIASLSGRPNVLAMVYTHCTSSCPLTVAAMQRIEATTDSSVGLVLVSLDPDRDDPAQLATFAEEHGLSARWTLWQGSDADVRDLAAALGVRFRRVSAAELAHSNMLTLLDANGAVVFQQAGANDPAAVAHAVQALNQ